MANESNIKDELKGLFKEHDYNQLYYKSDIVTYQSNGTTNFYQAIRNVPRYVPITDRRYWNQLNVSEGSAEDSTPVDDVDYLCFTANEDNSTLLLRCVIGEEYAEEESNSFPESAEFNTSDMTPHKNPPFILEYSIDKINWSILNMYQIENKVDFTLISDVIDFEHAGDKIYFRGDNINGTSFYDDSNGNLWYAATFVSNFNSTFAVSGDLQTIVDSTGNDKENGHFDYLFEASASVLITSAPDLTATTLLPAKYDHLFYGQSALTKPANMPNFSTGDLHVYDDIPIGYFAYMYADCTSLEEPADFNSLTITSQDDLACILYNLNGIYRGTSFNITDNNGETLNGFAGLTFPYDSLKIDSYDFADSCLNNTNGFGSDNPINIIIPTSQDYEINRVDFYAGKIAIPLNSSIVNGDTVYDANTSHYEFSTSPLGIAIEIFSSRTIMGWLYSTDGVNWSATELPAQDYIEIDIPTEGNHYYKPNLTSPK